jgi:nucleotide-binding universal stress UspA family protein
MILEIGPHSLLSLPKGTRMASIVMNRTWTLSAEEAGRGKRQVNIICPIDFSNRDKVILCYSLKLARQRRGKVILVHVLPSLDAEAEDRWQRRGDFESALTQLERLVPADPALCTECVVLEGDAADQIVDLAMTYESPQIVMFAGRRGRNQSRAVGQTAEEVLRRAPCPVVIVSDEDANAARRSGQTADRYSYGVA